MKTIFTQSTKLVTLLVLSFISFSSAVAQTAPVIFPYNGFDIDGNLKANNPTTDIGDWISGTGGSGQFVFNNDGSAVNTVTTYRFTDAYNSSGDNIFTGGGKFDDNPNTQWSWTNSKPGGKGDINNVLIHLGVDTNNKQWLIIASDRLVTTGTSYIDFEFFKNPISANAGGSFTLAGGRTVGDILLTVEYSNGGSTADVKFYRWNGSGYSLVTNSAANAFGKTNMGTVDTMAGTAFGTSQYTASQFVEAAINISAFLELSDPCEGAEFGSVLIKTKSSDSPSAALDDFAGPYPIKLVLGTASISYDDGSFCKNEGLMNVSLIGVTGGTFSAPSGLIINSTTGQIDITNSTPGPYTVTYSFSTGGCPKTVTTSVSINPMPIAAIGSVVNVSCNGGTNGSATASATSGTSTYSYSWNTSSVQNTATATGLGAGTYTVTVTDIKGCTDTEQVTITQPAAALSASITAQTNVLCFGNNTASVTVAGANGTSPYTYSKDGTTFVASGTFSGLTAGSYTITVKDANGCTTTQAVTITQPTAALSASITAQTNVFCFGNNTASVTVAGANGTSTYTYSKDGTTFVGSGVFSGLTAGSYTITVKDANGCTTTQAVTITQPAIALSASITAQTNVLCFGNNTASVTVTGANGTSPYTYSKNGTTFVTSGVFSGLTAGSYTITVKDANGCTTTQAVTITQPTAALSASITAQTNVFCFGNNTASVTVAGANGTSPYTYSKDGTTFVASGVFSGLTAGSYTITVKDANGCTTTQAVTITQPTAALSASITAQTNVFCFGNNTASVTVAGANGTSTYTYSKDGTTFVGSGVFSGLTAGSYTITVKDANGCTTTQAVTITQPAIALSASITAQTNVLCFGNNTASVTVTGANGTSPYTYSKNGTTFVTSGVFSGLTAGSYTITVKDANGCTTTQAVTITQPTAALSASITAQTNVFCFGDNTASVTVAGANGTSPYTYSKDGTTFVASGTFSGLTAGSYTITVKDANGCTTTKAVTITQPTAALSASITAQTNVFCFGNNTASVTVAGANGTASYTYSKDGTTFVASGVFSGLTAGSYTITVKDANGCTTTQAVTITQPTAALSASITAQTNVLCFGNNTASVTVTGANGTSPYTYSKSGTTFVTSGVFSGLTAGSYTITVKDANGCTTTQAVTITQPTAALSASITAQTNVFCYGDNTASVTVAGANGTEPYTYSKDGTTFVASGTFSNLTVGSYTITVKDANSCTTTQAVTITQPTAGLSATAVIINNNNCVGCSNGSIIQTVTGGTSPYTYTWSNLAITKDLNNLAKGTYSVEIKDSKGCTINKEYIITESGIALVKKGLFIDTNGDGFAQVGEKINYTFSVTNIGNVNVTNVIISDPLLGAINITGNPIALITVGQTNNSVTGTYTLTQADINAGKVINSATALGKDTENKNVTDISGTAIDNDIPTETLLIQVPEITITKDGTYVDSNHDGITNVGDLVTYNFVITNTGNVTLTNVTVTDNNAVITGGPIATLAVGATDSTTFSGSHVITQGDIDTGYVYNLATVHAKDPKNNPVTDTSSDPTPCTSCKIDPNCPDCTITKLTQSPKIALVKNNDITVGENGCATLAVGNVVTYTFIVTNPGNVSLHNVAVIDTHAGLSAIALQSGDANNNHILEVSETWMYKATYNVTQTDIDNGTITNQATVNGIAPNNAIVTDQSGDLSTNNAPNVIPICTTPKIALVKNNDIIAGENGCATLAVGNVVTYTFIVTNPGNVSLHNVAIIDTHAGLSAIALESGDANNNHILEVNETWMYKATYNVTQTDIDNGAITNQATVNGTAPNDAIVTDQSGDLSTNNAPNVIPICTTPKIALVKNNDIIAGENGCATLAVGDVVTYTFIVTNPGNVSLHNVAVIDTHAGLSAVALESGDANNNSILEVSETWMYKATYSVTQADIDNGTITNQATVNGTAPNDAIVTDQSGDLSTNNEPNVIPICTNPIIALVKNNDIEVGENGCATLAVGNVVTYTFIVTNPGNVSLHNVAVIDSHVGLSPIALQSGDANNNHILEVSETWMYKATYNVTQADIDNGAITNQATVNGTAPNDAIVTDQSGDLSTNNEPNVIPFCINPGLTVVKIATTPSYSTVGNVINYTINIKNTGNVTLHQIVIKDPLTGLDTIIEVLAPGASSEYAQSYTVTQEDLNKGSITNVATADGLTPNNTPISATDDEVVKENANPIDAVNDNAGTVVGVNQITANVINVFTNDTLNTSPVNPAEVILTTVTSNPYLQLNPNGSIDVLADAPVGIQTMTYQICEKLNSTNCDTATVTVTIEAPTMKISGEAICLNDIPYFSYTATADNFTPVNGLTLTWTDSNNNVIATMTNLPLNGKVLWPGATVDQNGNGTDWPGWVFSDGKWSEGADGFEGLKPTATITFTLNPSQTITVNYPSTDPFCTSRPTFKIDAVDDSATTLEGLAGVKNILTVFKNDSLNTLALNPADVTLSVLIPDPKGGITLNTDGSIDVKANTPTGIYTLTYQICEKADTGNCDTAIVTINITNIPLVIKANPDTFSVTQCSISEAIRNALSNDLLNGSPANISDFKFKLLTAIQQNINIDSNGNVTFVAGVAAGQYIFDYQICEAANPTNCATSTITINIAGIEPVTITSPSFCNDDTTLIDLNSLLPQGTATTGSWVDTDTTGGLSGSLLNAIGIPVGKYKFEYKIGGDCPRSIFLEMEINNDCKVQPCKTIIVHNALSANEDGKNDYFQIENLENNDCYKNFKVEIFNRWGILVFERDNYDNAGNAFRGRSEGRTTINKNEGLPTGTYFYIISYDSVDGVGQTQNIKKDGYLYLIR